MSPRAYERSDNDNKNRTENDVESRVVIGISFQARVSPDTILADRAVRSGAEPITGTERRD